LLAPTVATGADARRAYPARTVRSNEIGVARSMRRWRSRQQDEGHKRLWDRLASSKMVGERELKIKRWCGARARDRATYSRRTWRRVDQVDDTGRERGACSWRRILQQVRNGARRFYANLERQRGSSIQAFFVDGIGRRRVQWPSSCQGDLKTHAAFPRVQRLARQIRSIISHGKPAAAQREARGLTPITINGRRQGYAPELVSYLNCST